MDTDKHGLEKRWRATVVQDLAEMQNSSTGATRLGLRRRVAALKGRDIAPRCPKWEAELPPDAPAVRPYQFHNP